MINNEQKLGKLFGINNFRLKILRLYLEKGDRYFNNIGGLAKIIGASHATTRKDIHDLIDADILKIMNTGMSKLIMLNIDKTQARRTLKFLNEFLNEEFENIPEGEIDKKIF